MKASISLALAVSLLGCSSKSSTPSATGNVTPSGGTVMTSDGTSVVVPAGAVSQPTTITIGGESNSVSIDGSDLVGAVYRFGPEGTQFAQPVTVTIAYDPSKLASGEVASDVIIMTAPVGSTTFTELSTTIVDDKHVSSTTTHFSDFVAAVHRRFPHADMSMSTGVDLGGDDLAMSMGEDFGGASEDMTPNVDMVALCPHTFTSNTGTCLMTASCGGINYSLNCAQSFCNCQGGPNQGKNCPKPSPNTGVVGPIPQADVESVWDTCCMFP